MSTLRLYDPAFNYLFSFNEYSQLQTTLKYYGKSNLLIAVDAGSDAAHFLQVDNYITFEYNGKTYPFIIKQSVIKEGVLIIQASSPHELFERRVTMPPSGQYAVTGSGTPDKMIKDLIRGCTANNRALPFVLAANKPGGNFTETSRLKNLGDEIVRICEAYSIGETFTLDSKNKCFVFDTYQGADRTPGNADDNPPCVFSEKYHNLSNYQYGYDASSVLTTPVVAGAGEGEDREFLIVGGDAEGLDRYEALVDARDVEQGNTDLLRERGNAKVTGAIETVTTTENQNVNLVFGTDYDLGDLVAVRFSVPSYVQNNDYYDRVMRQVQVNQRVSEVTITIEGGAFDIDVKYGEITLSQEAAMTRDLAQLQSR